MKTYLTMEKRRRGTVIRLWFMGTAPRLDEGVWTAAGCSSVEMDPSALDETTLDALTFDTPLEVTVNITPNGKETDNDNSSN